MAGFSREMQRLIERWAIGGWPLWLESIEIHGLRGWTGQRISLRFPIVALVGENGSGKSTVLQALASVYRARAGERSFFASEFFPSTAWEQVRDVNLKYSVREGDNRTDNSVRKPTSRWLGNPTRRQRSVRYLDLRRIQPIMARTGYLKIAKRSVAETATEQFDDARVGRLSQILGKQYRRVRHSRTNVDRKRLVPVLETGGAEYSGFHQGAGETTVADLMREEIPEHALVLIDELETSLHPRAQRRLMRELATLAREKRLQIVLTTHSPYILSELPAQARIQIVQGTAGREIVPGITADYAMTQMDDEPHPEVDIYVEDKSALILMSEVLARYRPDDYTRVKVTPFGSAEAGKTLGALAERQRLPRPALVVLDGDQQATDGCVILPGGEAPERVVFADLESLGWPDVAGRLSRAHADLVDSVHRAMTDADHHTWLRTVANDVLLGTDELWRVMVTVWLERSRTEQDFADTLAAFDDLLPI